MSTSKFAPGLLGVEAVKSKSLRKFEVDIFKKNSGQNECMNSKIDNGLYNFDNANDGNSPMATSAQYTMDQSVSKAGHGEHSEKIDL